MLVPHIAFLFVPMPSLIDELVSNVRGTMSLVELLEHNIYRIEVMTGAFWLMLSYF